MVTYYDQVWSTRSEPEKKTASEEAGPKGLGLIASLGLSVDAGDVGTWAEVELETVAESLEESHGEAGVVLLCYPSSSRVLSLRLLRGYGRWAQKRASCSWKLRRIMGLRWKQVRLWLWSLLGLQCRRRAVSAEQ